MVKENGVTLSLPKGMKQTEIGLLPEGWLMNRVGNVISFSGGSQPPLYTFSTVKKKNYVRLIQIRDYKTQKYAVYIPQNLGRKFCTKNDIMIGRYGPPIFQILRGLEGAYNVALLKAIPLETYINKDFAWHFLRDETLFNFVEKLSQRSSGQTGEDLEGLRNYPIPLPPLPEQEAIAEALSDADEWIESLEKLIAKKCLIKQGAMQELLMPKDDWRVKSLGEVLQFGSGRDYKHLNGGDIPVYGTGGIMTFVDNYLYDGISIGIGRKGTIDKPVLLSGKFWTVDTLFFTHSFIGVDPTYIYYQFLLIPWREYNEASGVPSLNKNTLEQIEIKIPALAEQTRIATILSDMDAELEALTKQLEKARKIKHGMMQELLTGKIRLV